MRKTVLTLLLCGCAGVALAEGENIQAEAERWLEAPEVQVRFSIKETNDWWKMPSAHSLIGPLRISNRRIESIKDLSSLAPNLFLPDYGSKISAPVYLRGVGARSSGQSIGLYVDNVPVLDKSAYDVEWEGVQAIEVLRGPQGTLYGRNAMGGIIHVHTISPLDYQGTSLSVGGGNYGMWSAKASNYSKIGENIGISFSGYADGQDGFFTNQYTGKRVDGGNTAGGRLKLEWQFAPDWKASLSTGYDYLDQGAFAYGAYDKTTGVISPVDYNDRGSYLRNLSTNSLRFEHAGQKVLFSSSTGYQYLNDDMWMDQDFTPADVFTIHQKQNENALSQEFSFRSNTDSRYQWSAGAYGFYTHLDTRGDVLFKQDGITDVLQPIFDAIHAGNPAAPAMTITDTEIPNPGFFKTPSAGVALYHQSTFNDLLTDGLSLTLGLRFDFEKQFLRYDTQLAMNLSVQMPGPPRPPIPMAISTHLDSTTNQTFTQWLPKAALSYDWFDQGRVVTYASVAKGYKAGGYNVQMFSDVAQEALMAGGRGGAAQIDVASKVAYKPEITWNYELGTRATLIDDLLEGELALFFMDINDLQVTQFAPGGSGRILTNAGRAHSYGAEVAFNLRPTDRLLIDLNYGYTHATFKDYKKAVRQGQPEVDYSGNYIPYTPRNTFSLGASYSLPLQGWINQLTFAAQYNGAGKIYWTEANDTSQPFYGLLNAKATIRHEGLKLELWAKNLLAADYGAFYFESFGNAFIQKGKPTTVGANLVFSF